METNNKKENLGVAKTLGIMAGIMISKLFSDYLSKRRKDLWINMLAAAATGMLTANPNATLDEYMKLKCVRKIIKKGGIVWEKEAVETWKIVKNRQNYEEM